MPLLWKHSNSQERYPPRRVRHRYRLIDREGLDYGVFASDSLEWAAGDVIQRSDETLRVLAVVEPEDDADVTAYLVVAPA